jgi:hypothetical protein
MIAHPTVRTRWIVCVLSLALLADVLPAAEFAGGTGEPDNPYQIATVEQLCSIGSEPNLEDKHFVLIADIDLDPDLPGGRLFDRAVIAPDVDPATDDYQGTVFSGVFDGDGHTISNLTIQGAGCLGLFGRNSGVVRNVEVVNADVAGSGDYIGVLVGANLGSVSGCHSGGGVVGGSCVGGLIGRNDGGRVVRCYSDAGVGGMMSSIGGLVGNNERGCVAASYSAGAVTGDGHVGGLVGRNYEGLVSCCYSLGAVRGGMHIGGLIGQNWAGYVTHCYSAGAVVGESTFGGLVGSNVDAGRPPGVVLGCFWDIESSGQAASVAGTGVATAQMQDLSTFLAAGWDFADEIANGTCNYWRISAGEYPRLRYCDGESPEMPEGAGTVDEPYLIRDANNLGVIWLEPSACYRLDASIDLAGTTWAVAVVPWFDGTFDGNDCVIRNLHVEGVGYLGLFGQSSADAVISNLGLEAGDVNGTANYVGGLVGCHAGRVSASFCSGAVAGDSLVGGLVGANDGGIETSRTTGVVDGTGVYAGGLAGRNVGKIAESCSAGAVQGGAHVGGLSGCNDGDIRASYSVAVADGTGSYVGGFAGYNSGSIVTSHSAGAVSGPDHVGGFVGCNEGTVATSYSTGAVEGGDPAGGFAGRNSVVGSIASSFWDIETSGQNASSGGGGKTTSEMQTASTFLDAGWDFVDETANGTEDIWSILEGQGYPHLWWESETTAHN